MEGLVGYWSFDEASGTIAYDYSGYNNNGTMYSSTTPIDLHTSSNCKINICTSFNGIDNYIKASTIIKGIRSLSLWINTNQTKGPWRYLFDGRTGLDSTWITSYNPSTPPNGFGNKIIKMYVNGNQVNIDWNNIPLNQWAFLYFEFSQSFNDDINLMSRYTNDGCLNGLVDDFRIYNRALSDAEIQAIYNATK
jgi:hypothetical protein